MKLSGKNILVIDEQTNYLEFYRSILEKENYNVVTAINVKDAVSKLFGEKVDLILLDIGLPEIGGFKMAEIIRRHKKTKDIPLIMQSSLFCEKDIILSYKYGADLCLEKPALVSDIINSVQCLLHQQNELVS